MLTAWTFAAIHHPKARLFFLTAITAGMTVLFGSHFIGEIEPWIKFASMAFFLLLSVWLLGKSGFLRSLLSIGAVCAAIALCEFIIALSMQSLKLVSLHTAISLGELEYLLLKLLTALLMASMLPLVVALWRIYVDKRPAKSLHMFALVPVSQLFAIAVITVNVGINQLNTTSIILAGITVIIFVVADIGLLYALKQTRRNEELQHMNRHMKEQLQQQFEHYRQLAESTDRLQKLRHDMINHMETIRLLISEQPDNPAGDMLMRYSSEWADARLFQYCRNKIVDAVLINKSKQAQAKAIVLEIHVDWPSSTPYNDLDLCSLFANLLDNAIEAASHSTLIGDERFVRLDCYTRGGFLIVRCRNGKAHTIKRNEKGRILTTKRDAPAQHGIGLLILGDIASKYGGELKTEHGERYFQTTVYLSEESA